jgi:hypothetical protein
MGTREGAARARFSGWEVEGKLFGAGIVAIMGAIVGGGLEAFGIEVPVLDSVSRQILLAVVGVVLLVASFAVRFRSSRPEDETPRPQPHLVATQSSATSTRPRRLDAAMPREVRVDRPTEVWVQVLRSKSEGFRATLPRFTKSGEEIGKDDVRTGAASVPFPKDPISGRVLPLELALEITAPDFSMDEATKQMHLSATDDSGLVIFSLVPNDAHEHSSVLITATAKRESAVITVGSVSLITRILEKTASVQESWVLASVPLAAVSELSSSELAAERWSDKKTIATPRTNETIVGAPRPKSPVCSHCGYSNTPDVEFCQKCGTFLNWSGDMVKPPPETDEPATPSSIPGIEAPDPESVEPQPVETAPAPRSTSTTPETETPDPEWDEPLYADESAMSLPRMEDVDEEAEHPELRATHRFRPWVFILGTVIVGALALWILVNVLTR